MSPPRKELERSVALTTVGHAAAPGGAAADGPPSKAGRDPIAHATIAATLVSVPSCRQ